MSNNRQPRYTKGQRIGGRYLVHQALMGGMGEVYLCLDEQENLPRALKTFQGSDSRMRGLFDSEVENWISLEKHPNIVELFYTKTLDNIPFMLLEWIAGDESKGTDLRSWLRHGGLDLPLALRFTIDIVRGLQHANEKAPGIVHRDLKPENVLVNQSRQAKITDFGLATVAQIAGLDIEGMDEADMGQSRYVGAIVGTPAYMSPEQWRGEINLDFRTDIYAVGCILYELLTGKWLYNGRTDSELRTQHIEAPIPALNDNLPAELKSILNSCLAKRREDRYERIDLLLDELTKLYEVHSDEPLPEVTAEAFTALNYSDRGLTFHNLGQYERAIQDINHAIHLDPNFANAYYNRGNSYLKMGNPQRAIQDYDQALRLDPNFAIAYSNRGVSYNNLGQVDRAIQDFDQAIRLDPNLAPVYLNRGGSYNHLGQVEQAIQDINHAIHLDPNLAIAYYNRGVNYNDLGQVEQAIHDYDHAIHLDPNFTNAYYNRGNIYAKLGQHDRAIQDFDQAIRLDPNDADAYFNKGAALANTGHLQEALLLFEKAYALGHQRAAGIIQQVRQELEMQVQQSAFVEFQQATSLDGMRQVVEQFPVLRQMIPSIEQVIAQQVPPEHKPALEQKLAWLRHIVEEG